MFSKGAVEVFALGASRLDILVHSSLIYAGIGTEVEIAILPPDAETFLEHDCDSFLPAPVPGVWN